MPIPKLERTKSADEHGAKSYMARCRLLTMEEKKRNSFFSPSLQGKDVQGYPTCFKAGDRNFCYILQKVEVLPILSLLSSSVTTSSFLRKFSHFQFVLLAGLVSVILLIIEICLPVFWFCHHQSKKPKNHRSKKDLEWKEHWWYPVQPPAWL